MKKKKTGKKKQRKKRKKTKPKASRRCEVIKNNGYYEFHRSRAGKYMYSVRTLSAARTCTRVSTTNGRIS